MVSRVANPAPEATPRTAASGHLRRRSIRKTAVGTRILLLLDQANHEHWQRTECPQTVVLQCGSRDRTEDAARDRRERHSAGTDPDSAPASCCGEGQHGGGDNHRAEQDYGGEEVGILRC